MRWLRRYFRLEHGIASHDTFCRVFAAIDADQFGTTFRRWISTFAAGAALVLGQRTTAQKSNEKTAIPELLAILALEGCIVTINAMGTQPNIAQAIRARGADYVLSVKDNQPKLAESKSGAVTPSINSITCMHPNVGPIWNPSRSSSPGAPSTTRAPSSSAAIFPVCPPMPPESMRRCASIGASRIACYWCMDVAFNDDQMRLRTDHAAHNLAVLRQLAGKAQLPIKWQMNSIGC